jgi:hypothetical protein
MGEEGVIPLAKALPQPGVLLPGATIPLNKVTVPDKKETE